jgi:hypothetical protein
LNNKWAIGLLVAAGLLFLAYRSKPEAQINSTVPSSPTESTSTAEESSSDHGPSTFDGDNCTSDCSGHEAGYNWAQDNGIDDETDCDTAGDNSNSPSFAEGCRDYVRENASNDDSDNDADN